MADGISLALAARFSGDIIGNCDTLQISADFWQDAQ